MAPEQTTKENFIGGSIDRRVETAKIPPLDLPHVLAPYRRPDDKEAFEAFLKRQPLHIEVGFGRPHFICDLAAAQPDIALLGFEIKRRWCRDASKRATRESLDNLRVVEGDARPYLQEFVAPESVDAYYILFPDPWWKKRHHKRRIVNPDFLKTLLKTLRPGGAVHIRTDVPAYADLVEEQFDEYTEFRVMEPETNIPLSHREKKCREMGIPVFCFSYSKEGC